MTQGLTLQNIEFNVYLNFTQRSTVFGSHGLRKAESFNSFDLELIVLWSVLIVLLRSL